VDNQPLPNDELQYHGTTTLAFIFQEGVIVAVDSMASMGNYVGSRTVNKIFPLTEKCVATMAGGAADCAFWIRKVAAEAKIYAQINEDLPVCYIAKKFAGYMRENRGRELSVGTMIAGWDTRVNQPKCEFTC
jgi:20S proteasome subunit beta 5